MRLVRPAVLEVYQGPMLMEWQIVGVEASEVEIAKHAHLDRIRDHCRGGVGGFDPDLIRVLLPWRPYVRLLDLCGEVAPARPEQLPTKTGRFYGSSITHGNFSYAPSQTYVAHAARRLGIDAFNLGFGGGAWLEPELAEHIAGRGD